MNDSEKIQKVRDQLRAWDQITKGETNSTTRVLWDIVGREDVAIRQDAKPGAHFLHPDGRLCIKQHSHGWAVIREPAGMGPAKGKCSRAHDFEGD